MTNDFFMETSVLVLSVAGAAVLFSREIVKTSRWVGKAVKRSLPKKKEPPGIPTNKNGQRLCNSEEAVFRTGKCPDCEQPLCEGPSGGMSVNYCCLICASKFNDMGPFGVDRISDASPVLLESKNNAVGSA